MTTFDFGKGPVPAHQHINPDGTKGGWVANTAYVSPSIYLPAFVRVYEKARVFGNAELSGAVRIYGSAMVFENARISGSAHVCGKAKVFGKAQVMGFAKVTDNAMVCGDTVVSLRQKISVSAESFKPTQLWNAKAFTPSKYPKDLPNDQIPQP